MHVSLEVFPSSLVEVGLVVHLSQVRRWRGPGGWLLLLCPSFYNRPVDRCAVTGPTSRVGSPPSSVFGRSSGVLCLSDDI